MKKITTLIIFSFFIICSSLIAFAQTKIEENDYLKIECTPKQLQSRLGEIYIGYEYKIKNIYIEPITIRKVNIIGNANAQVAYLSVKKIPSFFAISTKIGNKNAENEANNFDIILKNETIVKPNQVIILKTMALNGHLPSLRLTYKNPLTDEDMDLYLK